MRSQMMAAPNEDGAGLPALPRTVAEYEADAERLFGDEARESLAECLAGITWIPERYATIMRLLDSWYAKERDDRRPHHDEPARDLFRALHTPHDYELNITLSFDLCRYPPRSVGDPTPPYLTGEYRLEGGREGARWRLRARFVPDGVDDDNEANWARREPPFLDLRDQDEGPDPLALLRALLLGSDSVI